MAGRRPPPLISAGTILLSIILGLLAFAATTTTAHNITKILAKNPEFSTFNHYLTATHLADDINRRETITVLAVDNSGMASLISKGFSLYTIRNILSLHVLVDYFGAKKLHQIADGSTSTSTVFQATGSAPGTSGYVNITDMKGGKVGFGVKDDNNRLTAHFVKSVFEKPYNISVLQISQVLTSAEAEAPTPGPSEINVTSILEKQGCKAFAELLTSSGADKTFQETIDGGLTVFCPTDGAVSKFAPKYKSLTAANKTALLLYHGVPVYQSLQMLRSGNGDVNTLATEGNNKFDLTVQNDGEDVTLETEVVTAKLTGTLKDEEPLMVYKIDKVLLPREIFGTKKAAAAAAAPKSAKRKAADGPDAESPESDVSDDQTADNDNGVSGLVMDGRRLATVVFGLCVVLFLM